MIEVVNNIAPLKTARIKNTSNEWFDREIAKKLSIRDKLFKKFISRLCQLRLGNQQRGKKWSSKNNKTEKTVSWGETVRKHGFQKKKSPSKICLKNKNGWSFDSVSIAETFKNITPH